MWDIAKCDLITLVLFGVYICFFRWKSKKIAEQAEADDITTADYAIYVEGFNAKNTTE